MDLCRQCGSELGVGRFCTNCGHPVGQPPDALVLVAHRHRGAARGWSSRSSRSPVADRARPGPVPALRRRRRRPPEQTQQLDRVHPSATPRVRTSPATPAGAPPSLAGLGGRGARDAAGGRVRGLAAVRQLRGRPRDRPGRPLGEHPTRGADADSRTRRPRSRHPAVPPTRAVRRRPGPLRRDLRTTRGGPRPRRATATWCGTSPSNMQDGVPETSWRTPGDGTGAVAHVPVRRPEHAVRGRSHQRLRQGRERRRRHPGLVPRQPPTPAVEWTFDDGTVVTQRFRDTTLLQMVRVDKVGPSR